MYRLGIGDGDGLAEDVWRVLETHGEMDQTTFISKEMERAVAIIFHDFLTWWHTLLNVDWRWGFIERLTSKGTASL